MELMLRSHHPSGGHQKLLVTLDYHLEPPSVHESEYLTQRQSLKSPGMERR